MPLHPTYDVNTSDKAVDGTPPGQTFRPLRYTQRKRDTIRVGVWMLLQTLKNTYRMNLELGLDAELIMDPETSDAERSALVADVVERYPGVVGFDSGPTVSLGDDGQIALSMVVLTEDGPFSLSL